MARPPRTSTNAPGPVTPGSGPLTVQSTGNTPATHVHPFKAPPPAASTRNKTRHSSISTPIATAPPTPVILTPTNNVGPGALPTTPGAGPSRLSKSVVEAKSHALRSVGGDNERIPCPFPDQWGGKDRCEIDIEDEKDEVLMAICAACATNNNRALTAEEIAAVTVENAWLRPPSAAVGPATVINSTIRAHQKRCSSSTPPRPPLLARHQLAGSVNESILESALHPNAFDGQTRPKGTVWYLASAGRAKWKNPFDGLEIPRLPSKKPIPQKKHSKENKGKVDEKKPVKGKTKVAPAGQGPVKLRLTLNATAQQDEDAGSEAGSSRSGGKSRANSATPVPIDPSVKRSKPTRMRNMLDSSDESDTSESEMEIDGPIGVKLKARKERPPPLPLGVRNPSRAAVSPFGSRSLGSPFIDWSSGNLGSPNHTAAIIPPPQLSPFPTHSLDNTTWAARHDADHFAAFETSSSSSDDETREPGDWGLASSILIRGSEEEVDDIKPVWSVEDEEAKVKEATDALRVLFPMSSLDEDQEEDSQVQLNRLDNRVAPSDTSSLAESSSTATASARRNPLLSTDVSSVALAAWQGNSSPAPSPNLLPNGQLNLEASPTQHLSRLHHSFEAEGMDVDREPWLDETGELPVKADDSLSDIDLGSTVGDAPTPEHDRVLNTAAWAREAAASTTFRVKDEPEDYPSPLTTEPDDASAACYRGSRASSSESHTPSSRSSELPPFEVDPEHAARWNVDQVLVGPESVSIDELDGYLPEMDGRGERTPSKRGMRKKRDDSSRHSGSWGCIGVGTPIAPFTPFTPILPATSRSTSSGRQRRSSMRRKGSAPRTSPQATRFDVIPRSECDEQIVDSQMTPRDEFEADEADAFGPADFERACAEAEAREEQHRKTSHEKLERQRAILEAIRQKVREAGGPITPPGDYDASLWPDIIAPWASSDSIKIQTPTALSPMVLHSVSSLSIRNTMPSSVDPKALLSPPLSISGTQAMPMLDEGLPQGEIEAAMKNDSTPVAPSTSRRSGPVPVAPAPAPRISSPTQQRVSPDEMKVDANPILLGLSNGKMTANGELPATLHGDPTASGKSAVLNPLSDDTISPSATISCAATGDNIKSSQSSASTMTVTDPGSKPQRAFTKRLCEGIDACVVDNIPVYAHTHEGKGGKLVVLRRLDTDFVNGTSLLTALGVPTNKHSDYLHGASPRLSTHHVVPASVNGDRFSPGVAGVWVQLVEARGYAKRLKLDDKLLLASILREDLFQLFAALAAIKSDHSASENFGLPFVTRRVHAISTPSSSSSSSSLTTSSANSKSTPNLTSLSLSASAPAAHLRTSSTPQSAATIKGPLVRSAPATPPDGCPQPKRRRATIVGDLSPLAKIAGAGVARKPPVRATRASVGGDIAKPKAPR